MLRCCILLLFSLLQTSSPQLLFGDDHHFEDGHSSAAAVDSFDVIRIVTPELGSVVNDDHIKLTIQINDFVVGKNGYLRITIDDGATETKLYKDESELQQHRSSSDLQNSFQWLMPTMMGKHAITAELLEMGTDEIVGDDRVIFFGVASTTWVLQTISADGAGLHSCRTKEECSFVITATDGTALGGSPPLGHHFSIRLLGPSLMVGKVEEVGGGIYKASYRVEDHGIYSMEVRLDYSSFSGLSLKAQEVAAGYCYREISGSPFSVTIHESDSQATASRSICTSAMAAEGVGRWVNRTFCKQHFDEEICKGVDPDRFKYAYQEDHPYVWIPNSCRLIPYDVTMLHQLLTQKNRRLLVVGNSLIRTVYFDLVRNVNASVSSCNWKPIEESYGDPMMFGYIGGMPPDEDAAGGVGTRYNLSLSIVTDAVQRHLRSKDDILVISIGFNEMCGERKNLSALEENFEKMANLLDTFKFRIIWMIPPAYHDRQHDLSHFYRTQQLNVERRSTTPKMKIVEAMIYRVMNQHNIEVFNSRFMTESRIDMSGDGIHYFVDGSYTGNAVSQTLTQSLLNALFNDELSNEMK